MRRFICLLICFFGLLRADAQKTTDTTGIGSLNMADLDLLFSEMDAFLDSLLKPRSFTSISMTVGNRMVNTQGSSGQLRTEHSLMLAPTLGYYHKSGIGLSAGTNMLFRENTLKPVQHSASASYDYLKNRNIMAGAAYTHFFAADSLDFYASPLQHEVSGYLAYRKSWLKPVLSVSYGWGSFTSVSEQETIIKQLRKKTITGTTRVTTTEKVSDIAVALSVRHDFYWLKVLSEGDNVRFSPQIAMSGGTQRYGLNQSSQTLAFRGNSANLKPFASENVALSENSKFQPLSLTAFLRAAYSKGKFFIQPQFIVDYYLPAPSDNLTTTFLVNTGFLF